MRIYYVFVMLFFIYSCKKEKENTLENYMIGNWETQYIKIEMPTVHNTDSISVFEDDFSKPNSGKAQSKYNEDGTFSAWFRLADGKKVDETSGKWQAKGDSLLVDYKYAGKDVRAWYVITKTDMGFEGKVIHDWDNDGEKDDKLFMKSKRIELAE